MALELTVQLDDGVTLSYWKIMSIRVNYSNQQATPVTFIELAPYVSEVQREAEKAELAADPPVGVKDRRLDKTCMVSLSGEPSQDVDLRSWAYEQIVKQQDWTAAIEV